jgi:hypothetical protein
MFTQQYTEVEVVAGAAEVEVVAGGAEWLIKKGMM